MVQVTARGAARPLPKVSCERCRHLWRLLGLCTVGMSKAGGWRACGCLYYEERGEGWTSRKA